MNDRSSCLAASSCRHYSEIQKLARAAVITLGLAAVARGADFYRLTDLGTLEGHNSSGAGDINESGQVVGSSGTGITARAVLWTSGGGVRDLGELPGGLDLSSALGQNNSGQVVGWSETAIGRRPFLWTSGEGMRNLGVLPGEEASQANAINDVGQVVGGRARGGVVFSDAHAFLWTEAGGMQDLGDLPGGANYSIATDINSAGHVVGLSSTAAGDRAFVWTAAGGMQDLGAVPSGFASSAAYSVNNSGQIVGWISAPAGTNAFLWTAADGMQDIGNFRANDINSHGQVVGDSNELGAVLWTRAGGMHDLSRRLDASGMGWTINSANAINDAGQIVGISFRPTGVRAVLLTPVPEPPVLGFTGFDEPPLGTATFARGEGEDEMGFVTVTSASGGASPLAAVADLGSPEGTRVLTHRSINATTTFEAIDLTNFDEAWVTLEVQVADADGEYAAGDFVHVYITNDRDTIDVLNLSGSEVNALADEGFVRFSTAIPNNWTAASLVIASSSDSTQSAERYDFDSIEFRGVFVIPEPGTCGLAIAAVVAAIGVRLRKSRLKPARKMEGGGGRTTA